MNRDLIDSLFGADDDVEPEFYPGSKRRRREPVAAPERIEASWDADPITKVVAGREIELFTIGALAGALDRPVVTIRRWERLGYIPSAPYRARAVRSPDGTRQGNRLYSRRMIEATLAAFSKRGLMGSLRLDWSRHTDLPIELFETWRKIHAEETAN